MAAAARLRDSSHRSITFSPKVFIPLTRLCRDRSDFVCAVWCGVVWCGVVRCGVVWCGCVVLCSWCGGENESGSYCCCCSLRGSAVDGMVGGWCRQLGPCCTAALRSGRDTPPAGGAGADRGRRSSTCRQPCAFAGDARTIPPIALSLPASLRSCGYCTFAQPPVPGRRAYMTLSEVLEVARLGAAQGCTEVSGLGWVGGGQHQEPL